MVHLLLSGEALIPFWWKCGGGSLTSMSIKKLTLKNKLVESREKRSAACSNRNCSSNQGQSFKQKQQWNYRDFWKQYWTFFHWGKNVTVDVVLGTTLSRRVHWSLHDEIWSWLLGLKRGLSWAICRHAWLLFRSNQKCGNLQRQRLRWRASAQHEMQRTCCTQRSARTDGRCTAWIWTKALTMGSLKFNWAHWTHQLTRIIPFM